MWYANEQIFSMYRAASLSGASVARIVLASAEQLLRRNALMTREVLDEYRSAGKQVEAVASLPELLALQERLVRSAFERSAQQWAGALDPSAAMRQVMDATRLSGMLGGASATPPEGHERRAVARPATARPELPTSEAGKQAA
jgi:hypothetical protein